MHRGSTKGEDVTYCVAAAVEDGLVFVSDSRTNAGVDQINTHSKMHIFESKDRFFVMLSAGNLATTQSVVSHIQRDIDNDSRQNLFTLKTLDDASEYVGRVSTEEQNKHASLRKDEDFVPEASFILGGQIGVSDLDIAQIYPQGNFIHSSESTPFLQIGEIKYGKPILDRIITRETPLANTLICCLVSMDSTLKSNATVGPPIEYLVYYRDEFQPSLYTKLEEDDEFLLELRKAWSERIKEAFHQLPLIPGFRKTQNNIARLEPTKPS